LHNNSEQPDILAVDLRISGMVEDDDDRAADYFQRAHEQHAQGFDPLAAARTRLLHGSRLRRAGRRTAARDQLRIAAQAFQDMGLNGWTARTENELAATGTRRTAAPGDALTSQETRVALLVARGQTNRDIAAALFLSPKTVEHHLTTILRKRGLRSRTELAVSMTRPR
jgi:DNA-binding NarL/FixJ family response regulator